MSTSNTNFVTKIVLSKNQHHTTGTTLHWYTKDANCILAIICSQHNNFHFYRPTFKRIYYRVKPPQHTWQEQHKPQTHKIVSFSSFSCSVASLPHQTYLLVLINDHLMQPQVMINKLLHQCPSLQNSVNHVRDFRCKVLQNSVNHVTITSCGQLENLWQYSNLPILVPTRIRPIYPCEFWVKGEVTQAFFGCRGTNPQTIIFWCCFSIEIKL